MPAIHAYGLFTQHGTGTGAGNGTWTNGSQYIVQKCLHWSEIGKGARPIVSYRSVWISQYTGSED